MLLDLLRTTLDYITNDPYHTFGRSHKGEDDVAAQTSMLGPYDQRTVPLQTLYQDTRPRNLHTRAHTVLSPRDPCVLGPSVEVFEQKPLPNQCAQRRQKGRGAHLRRMVYASEAVTDAQSPKLTTERYAWKRLLGHPPSIRCVCPVPLPSTSWLRSVATAPGLQSKVKTTS